MLKIPTGVNRSINEHNVSLDVFCDWIEASILFKDEELSSTDVNDTLIEQHIYEDQDFAAQIISDAWSELRRRQTCIGEGSPLVITSSRISRLGAWQEFPAYSFCLLLSFSKWYRGWSKQFGHDYTEQGELFEQLTKESLEHQFSSWTIHLTGWSRTRPNRLALIVEDVAGRLGESIGKLERWAAPEANEAGLDILCYRPFPDNRVGVPVYLMQCASGRDWEGKLHTPSLKLWGKVVDFTATPRRAFATPFPFLDRDFIRHCNIVDGMLLDRYRLLAAANHSISWISTPLSDRINAWSDTRVTSILAWE